MRLNSDNNQVKTTDDAGDVFADPVAYLAIFGIQAELISAQTELPEAA